MQQQVKNLQDIRTSEYKVYVALLTTQMLFDNVHLAEIMFLLLENSKNKIYFQIAINCPYL